MQHSSGPCTFHLIIHPGAGCRREINGLKSTVQTGHKEMFLKMLASELEAQTGQHHFTDRRVFKSNRWINKPVVRAFTKKQTEKHAILRSKQRESQGSRVSCTPPLPSYPHTPPQSLRVWRSRNSILKADGRLSPVTRSRVDGKEQVTLHLSATLPKSWLTSSPQFSQLRQ